MFLISITILNNNTLFQVLCPKHKSNACKNPLTRQKQSPPQALLPGDRGATTNGQYTEAKQSVAMLHVTVLLSFSLSTTLVSANHVVGWAIQNGAYLHPSLEYRNQGMYATQFIAAGEILAKVPHALEFTCENCTLADLATKLEQEREGFWNPFIGSLPTDCQNPLCDTELDLSKYTLRGYNQVRRDFPQPISNLSSMVMSRKWEIGNVQTMVPLLELFNHGPENSAALALNVGNADESVLYAKEAVPQGDQAYNNYNSNSHASVYMMYSSYGFIPKQKLTCFDMRMMRVGPYKDRVACIANSTGTTVSHMNKEIAAAIVYNDRAMIKGAAQFIDKQFGKDTCDVIHTTCHGLVYGTSNFSL